MVHLRMLYATPSHITIIFKGEKLIKCIPLDYPPQRYKSQVYWAKEPQLSGGLGYSVRLKDHLQIEVFRVRLLPLDIFMPDPLVRNVSEAKSGIQ